jgi:hypothetical protein
MKSHADKSHDYQNRAVANQPSPSKRGSETAFYFVDNRPTAKLLTRLQEMADNSPQTKRLQAVQEMADMYPQRLIHPIQDKRVKAVQAKLNVGAADDKYEQEADRVAKEVVRIISSPSHELAQRQEMEEEELMTPVAQRQEMEEEELLTSVVQRQVGIEGGYLDSAAEEAIQKARAGGQPLPDNVRASMEGAFGADFGGVKIHTGSRSYALNKALSARAFTVGKDIFFGEGEYNPDSSAGKEVLAHELTHVVQQNGVAVQRDVELRPQAAPLSVMNEVSNEQQTDLVARAIGPLQETTLAAIEALDEVGTLGVTMPTTGYKAPDFEFNSRNIGASDAPPQWVARPTLTQSAYIGDADAYNPSSGMHDMGRKESGLDVYYKFNNVMFGKVRDAEQEHIDDAKHAYKISLKEAEDVLNAHVIGKDFGPKATEGEVEQEVLDTVTANLTHAGLGNDKTQWGAKYMMLDAKTLSERDNKGGHTFGTTKRRSITAGKVTYTVTAGTNNVGSVSSASIIKY